jgi:hypothetical protein
MQTIDRQSDQKSTVVPITNILQYNKRKNEHPVASPLQMGKKKLSTKTNTVMDLRTIPAYGVTYFLNKNGYTSTNVKPSIAKPLAESKNVQREIFGKMESGLHFGKTEEIVDPEYVTWATKNGLRRIKSDNLNETTLTNLEDVEMTVKSKVKSCFKVIKKKSLHVHHYPDMWKGSSENMVSKVINHLPEFPKLTNEDLGKFRFYAFIKIKNEVPDVPKERSMEKLSSRDSHNGKQKIRKESIMERFFSSKGKKYLYRDRKDGNERKNQSHNEIRTKITYVSVPLNIDLESARILETLIGRNLYFDHGHVTHRKTRILACTLTDDFPYSGSGTILVSY